ncbi:hypothetical protein GCM10027164_39040 [Algoriphagus taiwanensis]
MEVGKYCPMSDDRYPMKGGKKFKVKFEKPDWVTLTRPKNSLQVIV